MREIAVGVKLVDGKSLRRTLDQKLRERNEAKDVRLEHRLDIRVCNVTDTLYALDEAGIVDYKP